MTEELSASSWSRSSVYLGDLYNHRCLWFVLERCYSRWSYVKSACICLLPSKFCQFYQPKFPTVDQCPSLFTIVSVVADGLTDGQGFVTVFHGGQDDVRAVDPLLVSQLFGLIKPLPRQVLQLPSVRDHLLKLPAETPATEKSPIKSEYCLTLWALFGSRLERGIKVKRPELRDTERERDKSCKNNVYVGRWCQSCSNC